jgi:single-strand DNA-binding protein
MASFNRATLVGHLGKDPKVQALPSGAKVASFSLATSERWKDKSTGEPKERTQWHQIVIFNEALVRIAEAYLRKGSQAMVEGQIETRKYVDSAGAERYVTEIVLRFEGRLLLLDKADRPPPSPDDYGTTRTREPAPPAQSRAPADFDDEIPF